jgi:SCY1-like protein 1
MHLFLEELALKDQQQKTEFFKSLPEVVEALPIQCCQYKVLPVLTEALQYGTVDSVVLAPLLLIGSRLPAEDGAIQKTIMPAVVKCFHSTDRQMRINLLQQLPSYAEHLSTDLVNKDVFPQVSMGFMDTAPAIRELTVKSMLWLAPKLTPKNMDSLLLPKMALLQTDKEPAIRTNTTVCLGKIAPHMTAESRAKVLVPGFCRALRDPFPPARISAIAALGVTAEYYDLVDIATKILPSVVCAAIDPEKARYVIFHPVSAAPVSAACVVHATAGLFRLCSLYAMRASSLWARC